jgi:DNA-binding transcriptional LysR family regulator
VALPAAHPLRDRSAISIEDLATEKLILPTIEEFPFYQQFIYYCQQSRFEPQIVHHVKAAWLMTILSLVVAEIGIAILPSNVQNLQRQGVVYRTIEDVHLSRQISAIWRRDDSSTILPEFLKVVREQCSPFVAEYPTC